MRRPLRTWSSAFALAATVAASGAAISCDDHGVTQPQVEQLDPALVASGKDIFRFDTFGDEKFWTDTLRMHEVIQSAVSPVAALSAGFKVDVDSLPQAVKDALAGGQVDLTSPATTVAMIG